jgi:asparagine synthetase B (glutamine-hydrolysing)
MTPLEMNDIFSFLHFGYLPYRKEKTPGLQSPIYEWSKLPGRLDKIALRESDIVAEGTILLRACFQNTKGQLHVVPLSGGIDSRVVLGGLMEAGLKESIVTATLGTPGSLDFEVGISLARRFGLRHEIFDLTKTPIDVNSLIDISKSSAHWTFLFDTFSNSLVAQRFGREAV